ncbi:hypothetical protein BHM03_00036642 [Ensete ventricosum]|nr:hypothetical protein BHM03_00036642 [Ensete ventricosum]
MARPYKRVRSGSPGSGSSHPMCQVDDCRAYMSSAKDYDRRHKVSKVHSGTKDKQTSIPPSTDRDRLVQFLSNLSASTEVNTSWRSSLPGGFDLTVSQLPPLGSLEESTKATGNENATSATTNLLTVLLAALAASAPDAPASLSQTVQQVCPSLPLQLFGPADDGSPPELGYAIKYLSESSNHAKERCPSSSPPVTKKLFPLHSTLESVKYARALECREENAIVELSTSHGRSAPIELFMGSETQAENRVLTSGSPIAVVGWQKSSLVLEGRNLIVPGTKSREVVLHFRNELGWLFQRTHRPSSLLSFA